MASLLVMMMLLLVLRLELLLDLGESSLEFEVGFLGMRRGDDVGFEDAHGSIIICYLLFVIFISFFCIFFLILYLFFVSVSISFRC